MMADGTRRRLRGKVAIVTGSSSGIGKAIALRFGEEGAKVVVAARRTALCERTVRQIEERGGEAWAFPTDVADERQVERLIAETVGRYGRLDVLVNNAGIGAGGRVADTATTAFD
jgi:3-oxoacyl-[acyl-carrier protein] reductase